MAGTDSGKPAVVDVIIHQEMLLSPYDVKL
jgi:hypothetical protein